MKFAPTFSPDGSQVAFAWDGGRTELIRPYDLYAKVIGYEQLRQLTHHPAAWVVPAWSPDGRNIAFVRDGTDSPGVFMISALGGPERKLADSDVEYFLPINLSWSPDSRTLAYATRDGMHTVDALSGEIRSIQAPPECPATYDPTFSPDGRWLAFSCYHYENYDLYVLPLGGGPAKKVTGVSEISLPIAWSNDSKRILFEQHEQLFEVSVDDGMARPLSFAQNGHDPAIAAVGERLAFVSLSRNVNLWRVNLKPTGQESVAMMSATSAEQSGPDISPDGKKICFGSSRSGSYEVWVSNLDGSDAVQLSHLHAEDIKAQWSPDGSSIVVGSVKSGKSSLFVVDPQVGVLRRIETGLFTTGYTRWSRDGRWIYFVNEQAGTRQGTYKVSVDGAALQFVSPKLYCNVQEAKSGNTLYFMNGPTHEVIYERDLSTGVERPVNGMPRVATAADWALASDGIYFIDISGETASIGFFDFKTRRVTRKIPLPKPPVFFGGLALAPDESWLAYSQVDRNDSDLMLAEGFR